MDVPDGARCAAFIFGAFIPVGLLHTAWLRSPWSRHLAVPLDFGKTWRGRRIFGENKMLRGLIVLVPGGGLAFLLLSTLGVRPWPLSALQYAVLGSWAGSGFILAELPNSFIKRQLDIAPGQKPDGSLAQFVFLIVDRVDSLLGLLVALSLLVPLPWLTWVIVLGVGIFVHAFFSIVMYQIGVKARPL